MCSLRRVIWSAVLTAPLVFGSKAPAAFALDRPSRGGRCSPNAERAPRPKSRHVFMIPIRLETKWDGRDCCACAESRVYARPSATAAGPNVEADSTLIVPGWGLRGIVVGRSTPEDVLAELGRDCKISTFNLPWGFNDINEINYDYTADEVYSPDRPENSARPSLFQFSIGVLSEIHISSNQRGLRTTGGIVLWPTAASFPSQFSLPFAELCHAPIHGRGSW